MNILRHNSGRWKALGLQALGDGIADAAVAWRYELAEPEERRNPTACARSKATIAAGAGRAGAGEFRQGSPPSAKSRWPAPWAISISACPTLIGRVPTPNCRPGMRVLRISVDESHGAGEVE